MVDGLSGINGKVGFSANIVADGLPGIVAPKDFFQLKELFSLVFGSGVLQVNQFFHDTNIIALSSSDELDLWNNALVNPFGRTIAFVKVKCLFIRNTSDELATPTAAKLVIAPSTIDGWEGPFANAVTPIQLLPGSSVCFLYPGTGWAVFNDEYAIDIVNTSGTEQAQYDVVLLGIEQ